MMSRTWWLFGLLCVVWGSGWIALKIGVAALPPLLFASSRFLATGLILLAVLLALGRIRGVFTVPWHAAFPGALLMIAVNYGLMAWGIVRVTSGLAAVVNLTTVPLAMAVCGKLYGLSHITRRAAAGLFIGSCGLAALLLPPLAQRVDPSLGFGSGTPSVGLAAIVAGAAAYAWGSVVTRCRIAAVPALELSVLQALLGGGALLIASAAIEPWAGIGAAVAEPMRLGGWLFLVAVSVASTPAYLALLARWEPSRVAAYAYVCPVIAVVEGSLLGGELLTLDQGVAALVLGVSAFLVLGVSHNGQVPPTAHGASVAPPSGSAPLS